MELNTPPPSSQDPASLLSQQPPPAQTLSSPSTPLQTSSTDDLFSRVAAFDPSSDPDFLLGLSDILDQPGALPSPAQLQANHDLVRQATCFYLSRKWNLSTPIDPAEYSTWLQTNQSQNHSPTPPRPTAPTPNTAAAASTIPVQPRDQSITNHQPQPQTASSIADPAAAPPPPYPTSFAEIVDLITQNKPIPGIQEIPATVLDLGSSKQDTATRRRKPWEKDPVQSQDTASSTPTTSADTTATSTEAGSSEDKVAAAEAPAAAESTAVDVDEHKRTGEGVMKILQPGAVPDSGLIAKE